MRLRTTLFITAIVVGMIASTPVFPAAKDKEFNPKKAVVQIFTTYQKPNYDSPWQMHPHGRRSGSGCVIRGDRILTNAHVVSDQTFIQVRKAGEVDRFTAEVEYIAHECDLALLKVTDPAFFKDTQSAKMGGVPDLRETVNVYGFPVGGSQLAVTEGVVSRIECDTYFHSRWNFLTLQIDARVAAGNSGGPVFRKDRLVGIAFQSGSSDEAIPVTVINHFLKDVIDKKYNGFPDMGALFQKLESPTMRENLGMKSGQSGIYITEVLYNSSAWNHLHRGDVIMNADGISIANDGTIPFKEDRVQWTHLIDIHHIGESLLLGVLRKGEAINVEFPLKGAVQFVPRTEYEKFPTYYIYAGMIFMPLNENYVDTWRDWTIAPNRLLYYFFYKNASAERTQAVVMTNILAHDVNIGYQDMGNDILIRVNGHVIKDMRHLKTILESNTEKFVTFDFESGGQIVIDPAKAREARPDILEKYRVSAYCSKDLE